MKVRDLAIFLATLDQDMEVAATRFSDYEKMEMDDWSVIQAIEDPTRDWLMRVHETMQPAEKARAKSFLHYAGN